MSYYSSSSEKVQGCLALITVLLVIVLLFVKVVVYPLTTKSIVTGATIVKMERVGGDKGKYLVFTDEEVLQNTDCLVYWKFDSSDIYGELEVGKTYDFGVYGWRIPFFSMYKNILTVREVKQ